MISYCFITIFAVLINKVCLQVTVEAVIGGSVVLQCSSAEHDYKPQDIDVSWRHNGSKIVFDIIPLRNSPMTQDPEYKNRIETFPQEYLRGNFSIKLINLQHTDAGQYICYMKNSNKYQTLKLIISGGKGAATVFALGLYYITCVIGYYFHCSFLYKKVLKQPEGNWKWPILNQYESG
ncbi:CD276 antigen homolog isoform X1 [Carassius gibelio]|uniref:CD276 antigen homolog isoform X1 n=1 Tax=Carassius gibelio TaxID=101364 RepID=UPI0022778BA8|nr:CD276 antigen homolog isoform X1 [Carassius gibelio]